MKVAQCDRPKETDNISLARSGFENSSMQWVHRLRIVISNRARFYEYK